MRSHSIRHPGGRRIRFDAFSRCRDVHPALARRTRRARPWFSNADRQRSGERGSGLPQFLLVRQAWQESRLNAKAYNASSTASGIMQIVAALASQRRPVETRRRRFPTRRPTWAQLLPPASAPGRVRSPAYDWGIGKRAAQRARCRRPAENRRLCGGGSSATVNKYNRRGRSR